MTEKKATKARDVVRFQFEIAPDLWNGMQKIQELGSIPTKRELLNNALTLFRWAALQVLRGNTIAAVKPDGNIIELQMPSLENIALGDKPKLELVPSADAEELEGMVNSKVAA